MIKVKMTIKSVDNYSRQIKVRSVVVLSDHSLMENVFKFEFFY